MMMKQKKKASVIAFYLPQFHPIQENDKWWGKGFTEWTNVAKAKPLFRGHYQPRVPADLGFYDLRLPEIREAQAQLAREAGIDAFCYWHYWFGSGKQLMEWPLQEVVRMKQPDFPFCLGWAFYKMLPVFLDSRYFRLHDKLVFLIYDPSSIPHLEQFIERWQELAVRNNLPGFYFIAQVDAISINAESNKLFDAINYDCIRNLFNNSRIRRLVAYTIKRPIVKPYKSLLRKYDLSAIKPNRVYPTIYPNWDVSPRIGYIASVLHKSTPQLFEQHVNQILNTLVDKPNDDKVIFLKSWNEWAEGNYMEPDLKFGKEYIYALRRAIYE